MKISNMLEVFALAAILALTCSSLALADFTATVYDNFDDGNYDGWTVGNPLTNPSLDIRAPEVVTSPEGYSLRGTGSCGGGDWNCAIVYSLGLSDVTAIRIEMRAKSGSGTPSEADILVGEGTWPSLQFYYMIDYGEANRAADWLRVIRTSANDTDEVLFQYGIGDAAYEWHTYAWSRDALGWWSLSIDDVVVAANFQQDLTITDFDSLVLQLHRDQSEIEWVRVTATVVPVPGAVVLGGIGLSYAGWRLRRRRPV